MKIIDMPNPSRVNKEPDKIADIVSSGDFSEKGFVIKKIQLRQYVEKIDEKSHFSEFLIIYYSHKNQFA